MTNCAKMPSEIRIIAQGVLPLAQPVRGSLLIAQARVAIIIGGDTELAIWRREFGAAKELAVKAGTILPERSQGILSVSWKRGDATVIASAARSA